MNPLNFYSKFFSGKKNSKRKEIFLNCVMSFLTKPVMPKFATIDLSFYIFRLLKEVGIPNILIVSELNFCATNDYCTSGN